MNVELPSDMGDFVHGRVVAGRFASEQEAIAEGLRLLKSREELKADIAKGFRQLDEGEWLDGEAVFAELQREIAAIENEQLET